MDDYKIIIEQEHRGLVLVSRIPGATLRLFYAAWRAPYATF